MVHEDIEALQGVDSQLGLDIRDLEQRIFDDLTGKKGFPNSTRWNWNKDDVQSMLNQIRFKDGNRIVSHSMGEDVSTAEWINFNKGYYATTQTTRAFVEKLRDEKEITMEDFVSFYYGIYTYSKYLSLQQNMAFAGRRGKKVAVEPRYFNIFNRQLESLNPTGMILRRVNWGLYSRGLDVHKDFKYPEVKVKYLKHSG